MSTPPTPTPQELLEALKQVKYPGFNRDIVAFGVVKDIAVGGAAVVVELAPSTRSLAGRSTQDLQDGSRLPNRARGGRAHDRRSGLL